MSGLEFEQMIRQLKTTRKNEFTDQEVKIELLSEILAASLGVANASNRQSYSVILLDTEKVKALAFPGNKAMVFCLDFYRLRKVAQTMGLSDHTGYLSQFITAICDVSILAQTVLLAATSKGLHTQITNSLYYSDLEKVSRILELPDEGVMPLLSLGVGYAQTGGVKKGRLPLEEVIHYNAYSDTYKLSTEELIRYYDGNEMPLIGHWNEMGYSHYLEWFFTKWAPAVGSRGQSKKLENWLYGKKLLEQNSYSDD